MGPACGGWHGPAVGEVGAAGGRWTQGSTSSQGNPSVLLAMQVAHTHQARKRATSILQPCLLVPLARAARASTEPLSTASWALWYTQTAPSASGSAVWHRVWPTGRRVGGSWGRLSTCPVVSLRATRAQATLAWAGAGWGTGLGPTACNKEVQASVRVGQGWSMHGHANQAGHPSTMSARGTKVSKSIARLPSGP